MQNDFSNQWEKVIPFKDRKDVLEQHKIRPKNLDFNISPELQPEILNKSKEKPRKEDEKIRSLQQSLVCASNALAIVGDALLDAKHKDEKPNYSNLVSTIVQANGMLGQVHCFLSHKR